VTTALYRRYRPQTYADVIGQEHVTEPLMQALRSGRVGHAYLFSGPRGCGKTTSARILARCLNCEQGPTPTPCGECPSCVALATGGPGSVDVIEIDAASHGGVDDARDLREKAAYGPAQSRFKVYIIDEAHMVTPQGFNALLKIVEEPPEHVKFVFATTEPEKVIGTIRSRTHHYPFRLVPPTRLSEYLESLCAREGVAVEPGVLSFVVRAGGGSVRDSLSVLDQLIAGSGPEGLTYAGAAALLGFTEAELLDAVVDALAAGDGGAVFRQLDKVIETGHDPRRFVEDLLERFRDLIIVSASEDAAAAVLRGVPEDQLTRMRQQAASFGPGELSRSADIVNAGLTELSGATAPRLQLELICARLLLPAAAGPGGYAARLDRLERRLERVAPILAPTVTAEPPAPPATTASEPRRQPQTPPRPRPAAPANASNGEGPTWSRAPGDQGTAPSWATADPEPPPEEPEPPEDDELTPLERARVEAARTPDPETHVADDSAVSADDEDIEALGEVGIPVVERILGGTIIKDELS
jgi:DNA polymerase-3 subunit gamma/tau